MDLDGNTLLVEELFNDAAGRSKQGAAYLFEREWITSTVWTEVRMFTAPDGPAQDIFGVSVAISGDTIAIGAVRDDDMGANSGSAYLYERDQGGPGNWGLVTKLVAFDGVPAANFGKVDLQGDTLVVGASGGDTAAPTSGFSPTPTSTTAGQLFFPIFSLPDVR